MESINLKRVPFINPSEDIKSFSFRAAAIMHFQGKYLMVVNENDTKYKHPGGHLESNESLIEGLKREIKEETGLDAMDLIDAEMFFDYVPVNGNIMINAYFQISLDQASLDSILNSSPLPSKLLTLEELNLENSWECEIRAIKYLQEKNEK